MNLFCVLILYISTKLNFKISFSFILDILGILSYICPTSSKRARIFKNIGMCYGFEDLT